VNFLVENKAEVARLGGFEPPTSGSGDQRQIYILLVRSVLSRI
jgi:hypothetical protein